MTMSVSKAEVERATARIELRLLSIDQAKTILTKIDSLKPVTPEEERFVTVFLLNSILNGLNSIREELASGIPAQNDRTQDD